MPPVVAFVLCLIFVTFLLWIESGRFAGRSKVVWIPTLWMLYCASRPISQWLAIGPSSDPDLNVEAGNPIERVILSLFIVVGLVILTRRPMNWRQIAKDNRWLIALFFYMFLSIFWSDYPFVSFKRYVKTAGTVVMALVVLSEQRPSQALWSIFIRTAYVLIPFSALLVKYFHQLGADYNRWSGTEMWKGVTLTKNTLGVLCMVSALFLIWALVRRWEGKERDTVRYAGLSDLIVLLLSLWLLRGPGGSYSATSVATLVLGLAIFFIFRRLRDGTRRLNSLACRALVGVGLAALFCNLLEISPTSLVTSSVGRNETFTGRTEEIWAPLFKLAMENPVLGVGFGGFWVKVPDIFDFPINEAHNGYLDVFIQLGAVGIIVLFGVLVSFYQKARAEFNLDADWASFRLAVLVIAALHNVTETSWLGDTMLLWNLFVCLVVVYPASTSRELALGQRGQQSPSDAEVEARAFSCYGECS